MQHTLGSVLEPRCESKELWDAKIQAFIRLLAGATHDKPIMVTQKPYNVPRFHQRSTLVVRRLMVIGIQMNRTISRHAFGDPPLLRSDRKLPVAHLSRYSGRCKAYVTAPSETIFSERNATGSQSHD